MKNLGDEPCKGWDPSRIQRQISSNLFVVFKIVSIKNCCYCVVASHLPALLPILYTNVESTAKTQMYRHFQRRTKLPLNYNYKNVHIELFAHNNNWQLIANGNRHQCHGQDYLN